MIVVAVMIIILAVIGLQGYLFNRFGLSSLSYSCTFSTNEAHAGDNVLFIETVANKKLLPVPWLKADIHTSKWLDFASKSSVLAQDNRRVSSSFYLRSFQKTVRRWNVKCLKRGIFEIENVTLLNGDLLGNHTNSIAVPVRCKITVYPEIIDLSSIFSSPLNTMGDTTVKRWIHDDPFIIQGLRPYDSSDPLNRIHWLSSSKTNELIVKKNDYTSDITNTVLLNIQSIEFEYDKVINRNLIELGIKAAATLMDRSASSGIPFRFGSNCISAQNMKGMILTNPGSGTEHLREQLTILSNLSLENERSFSLFLESIYSHLYNSQICIITSFINSEMGECIKVLSQNNSISIYLLDQSVDLTYIPDNTNLFVLSEDNI